MSKKVLDLAPGMNLVDGLEGLVLPGPLSRLSSDITKVSLVSMKLLHQERFFFGLGLARGGATTGSDGAAGVGAAVRPSGEDPPKAREGPVPSVRARATVATTLVHVGIGLVPFLKHQIGWASYLDEVAVKSLLLVRLVFV